MTDFVSVLRDALPFLDDNLSAAHREYMGCDIPAGAYRHVLMRHTLAYDVANRLSERTIQEDDAMMRCAMITMDIKTAQGAEAFLGRWLSCYDSAGFTDRHALFGFPVRPS